MNSAVPQGLSVSRPPARHEAVAKASTSHSTSCLRVALDDSTSRPQGEAPGHRRLSCEVGTADRNAPSKSNLPTYRNGCNNLHNPSFRPSSPPKIWSDPCCWRQSRFFRLLHRLLPPQCLFGPDLESSSSWRPATSSPRELRNVASHRLFQACCWQIENSRYPRKRYFRLRLELANYPIQPLLRIHA